jgi:hypothetical protein
MERRIVVMVPRDFKLVSESVKYVLATETQVFVTVMECPALEEVVTNVADIHRAVPVYLENSRLNWMATCDADSMKGIHRIQGYQITDDGTVKPCSLSTGVYGAVMLDDLAYFRKQGILLVGKAKSQTDVFYKWHAPHLNTIPLWNVFMDDGKLFKEFQRCLGGTIVQPINGESWKVAVVDVDAYMSKVHALDIKDAGDGVIITRHSMTLAYGGVIEDMYSFGLRILDHPVLKSVKGNLVSDKSLHEKYCRFLKIDPMSVDIILPKVAVKVGSVNVGDIIDVTNHIRFISYRTERVQSYGRITTVGACTLGKYALTVCDLINRFSNVDKITKLCSEVIEGNLSSYAKAVRAGQNSSVMAEVSAIALPIWKDDKWQIIKTKEHIDQLYSRVTSIHQKQVRKVKLKRTVNRRAYWTPGIELANKGNHTGAAIVRLRHGVIELPQDMWVGRTLGDFDGDDAVIIRISKFIYLIFRNPVNGPSSMFVGLEKGKVSVQDVPEWAMPLVRYHREVHSIPEPVKSKLVIADTLKGRVDQYMNTLLNAWCNSPLLGQATNRLYKSRIGEICVGNMFKPIQYAHDSAKIEFEVVKAIKSTLESSIGVHTYDGAITFGGKVTRAHCLAIEYIGKKIEQYNRDKLGGIFPPADLGKNTTAFHVWNLCTKYNYAGSYQHHMELIVDSLHTSIDSDESLVRRMPVVTSCKGYTPDQWINRDDTDVIVARAVCKQFAVNKTYYKLPAINLDVVRKINTMYMIFTAKRNPSEEVLSIVQVYLQKSFDNVRANNVRGDDLVKFKIDVAKTLFRRFMYAADGVSIDTIITKFRAGANILLGVRDIYDTSLRSFAYACIHAYIRAYIINQFSDERARMTALFETGLIVFGMNDGSAKSSRLFWQYFSTFNKDSMIALSNMWMDAQSKMSNTKLESVGLDVDMMADLFDHAHNVSFDDIGVTSGLDLDDLFDEECEFGHFPESDVYEDCCVVYSDEEDFDPNDLI